MGDRIVVEVFHDLEPVQLYCHWSGIQVLSEVQYAISDPVGQDRWADPGYLTRIIFQHVIGEKWDSTGFGIYPGGMTGEYPNIQVYPNEQVIKFGDNTWSFEEFCEADIQGFCTQYWDDRCTASYEEYVSRTTPPKTGDNYFREALSLYMALDLKLPDMEELLNSESKSRGYDDWVVAYHEFEL